MAGTDSPDIEARAADRVVVFSDAVVAIAITLLALDLPVPRSGTGLSDLGVLQSLGHASPFPGPVPPAILVR